MKYVIYYSTPHYSYTSYHATFNEALQEFKTLLETKIQVQPKAKIFLKQATNVIPAAMKKAA